MCFGCSKEDISDTTDNKYKLQVIDNWNLLVDSLDSEYAAGSIVESCFVCGKTVSSETKDATDHAFDGGVIKSMPTTESSGEIVYTCLVCSATETVEIAPVSENHICDKTVVYENGFGSTGLEIGVCQDCGCVETVKLDALIIVLGYSVSEDKTGIIARYRINKDALLYYEEVNGKIEIGFMLAAADDVANYGMVNEDNTLAEGVNGCQIAFQGRDFRNIEVKLFGTTTEQSRQLNFIFTAYAIANDKISFIQYQDKSSQDVVVDDYVLKAINVNKAYEE